MVERIMWEKWGQVTTKAKGVRALLLTFSCYSNSNRRKYGKKDSYSFVGCGVLTTPSYFFLQNLFFAVLTRFTKTFQNEIKFYLLPENC